MHISVELDNQLGHQYDVNGLLHNDIENPLFTHLPCNPPSCDVQPFNWITLNKAEFLHLGVWKAFIKYISGMLHHHSQALSDLRCTIANLSGQQNLEAKIFSLSPAGR